VCLFSQQKFCEMRTDLNWTVKSWGGFTIKSITVHITVTITITVHRKIQTNGPKLVPLHI